MKKLLAILLAGVMALSLVACGGGEAGGASGSSDSEFVGEWKGVGGETWGFAMTADDADEYLLSITDGDEATLTTSGEPLVAKYTTDGDKITFTVEELDISSVGTLTNGAIYFEDLLGLGVNIYFAKEGTAAADPALYIPEADKAMVGTWTSYAVTDILDEDVSDVIPADALVITFNGDYTADIAFGDETFAGQTWSLSEGFGYIADGDCDLNWDVVDDEIVVSYSTEDDILKFTCAKN